MNDEDASLTFEELRVTCSLDREWLLVRVREGLISAAGGADPDWRFTAAAVTRARRMRDIERAYDAAPELAALVADLLEQIEDLRAQLTRLTP
jgi:chaperone modulatory protein CbpM